MEEIVVTGGEPLNGSVAVLGAKNAVLKQMVAMLLAPGTHLLHNVPGILDVVLMGRVLEHIGATCSFNSHTLTVEVPDQLRPEAPLDLVRQMRASIVVLGPLLARGGVAKVAFPGGDDLGARPIDMHIDGLRKMGAEFELEHGVLMATAPGGLVGAEIGLEFPSVGATENVLLGAVLAAGETTVHNAAREPEIEDLATFLVKMGARIQGAGTSIIKVEGVETLRPTTHHVLADRLEAGTYAVAGAITGGEVRVERCVPDHLRMELRKLADSGCVIERGDDWVTVAGPARPNPVDFATLPFPGFHTDMQPQMVALLSVASGTSVITENIYDARFRYAGELMRMGADITTEWQHAVIRGVEKLSGCPVIAPDIRAGASLVLAALRAEGETVVGEIHHIDRGYEDFVGRLQSLGGRLERRPAGAAQ
jgi:UDP-N-acetylglucosamine 1-carboxyvinyltransferase